MLIPILLKTVTISRKLFLQIFSSPHIFGIFGIRRRLTTLWFPEVSQIYHFYSYFCTDKQGKCCYVTTTYSRNMKITDKVELVIQPRQLIILRIYANGGGGFEGSRWCFMNLPVLAPFFASIVFMLTLPRHVFKWWNWLTAEIRHIYSFKFTCCKQMGIFRVHRYDVAGENYT